MFAFPEPLAANPLAEQWCARRRTLEWLLETDPFHLDAERWQIQARILAFLLARYGDDPGLCRPEAVVWIRSVGVRPVEATSGKPARSGDSLRPLLERIAEVNQCK